MNVKVGINLKKSTELQNIIEEIEGVRAKLNEMVSEEEDTLLDGNIIKASELLDQLLVKYYILK